MIGHARRSSIRRDLWLIALGCIALFLWSPARAADAPDAAECLRLLSRAFPPSLPNHVIVRSKAVWPDGVTVTHCHYHGDDRRSLVRTSNFRIREQDGRRVTSHSTTLLLSGGTWLAEAARNGPLTPGTEWLSIQKNLTQRDTWRLPADVEVRLKQGVTSDPLPHFEYGAIAFGFMNSADRFRLWELEPGDRVSLHSAHDRIDDADTIAVRIESSDGVRTLWLDPALGMLPRQLALEYIPPQGVEPPPDYRERIHTIRFDTSVSPPAIIGFVVDYDISVPLKISYAEVFTIQRRHETDGPTDQDFRDAIDLPDGTPVRVDGLGLNSHAWFDGLVVPTRRVQVP